MGGKGIFKVNKAEPPTGADRGRHVGIPSFKEQDRMPNEALQPTGAAMSVFPIRRLGVRPRRLNLAFLRPASLGKGEEM
jgi:hypothetical protein